MSPSRRSTSATASDDGVTRRTWRQRDRNVTEKSSGSSDGAQSRNTVRSGGSSTALSRALPACSVSRSASSMTTTCQRPVLGRRAAVCTISRISPTAIDRPCGITRRRSAVRARHGRRTCVAVPAADDVGIGALQRGRETQRGDRAARPRRAGEQPGVRHRRARFGPAAGRSRRRRQFRLDRFLADESIEHSRHGDHPSGAHRQPPLDYCSQSKFVGPVLALADRRHRRLPVECLADDVGVAAVVGGFAQSVARSWCATSSIPVPAPTARWAAGSSRRGTPLRRSAPRIGLRHGRIRPASARRCRRRPKTYSSAAADRSNTAFSSRSSITLQHSASPWATCLSSEPSVNSLAVVRLRASSSDRLRTVTFSMPR